MHQSSSCNSNAAQQHGMVPTSWPSAGAARSATIFVKEEYPYIAVSTEKDFEWCCVSSHQVAYVCGVVVAPKKFVLQSVFTPPDERRQGIATSLILRLAAYCTEHHGVTVIELDDMSDHYRQNDNLYLKLGFNYLEDNGPEMHAKISTVLKCMGAGWVQQTTTRYIPCLLYTSPSPRD